MLPPPNEKMVTKIDMRDYIPKEWDPVVMKGLADDEFELPQLNSDQNLNLVY